jgi:hypothetical protein
VSGFELHESRDDVPKVDHYLQHKSGVEVGRKASSLDVGLELSL